MLFAVGIVVAVVAMGGGGQEETNVMGFLCVERINKDCGSWDFLRKG